MRQAVATIPTLFAKGFDAREAVEVLLREVGGKALARLEEAIRFEKHAFALGGRTRDCVALFNQNVALLQEQKDELIARAKAGVLKSLRRGSIIAFGYVPPVAATDSRVVIDPKFWDFLRLDFESGEARGGNREYVGVRMIKFDDLSAAETQEIGAELRRRRAGTEAEPRAPSFPGRPSVMNAVAEKMRDRAARGELCGSLSAESRYLETWAEGEFPGQQTPKAKSIYNALASTYRSLKGGKAAAI